MCSFLCWGSFTDLALFISVSGAWGGEDHCSLTGMSSWPHNMWVPDAVSRRELFIYRIL